MSKDSKLKITVFILRSVLLIVAGVCFELGTAYLGDMANGELGYLWKVLIVAALFGVYLWYSSTMRPIKSLDNDVSGPLAVLIFAVMSFADNFLAGLFPSLAPQNVTISILLILCGSVLVFLNIFVVDKFYEKFDSTQDSFYFIGNETGVGEKTGAELREYWQKKYNRQTITALVISAIIVVLVMGISIYWIGVDLWWRS